MNLNTVDVTVSVAGTQVVFSKLSLTQAMNSHHRCEVLLDYDAFGDSSWLENPIKVINFIGESLIVSMKHRQTGESNTFIGLVSDVAFEGSHGMNNNIIIYGTSETIKLDGAAHMDSFVKKTLKEIVTEVVATSGNGAAVEVKPEFSHPIDYQMQYNESAFAYLNRLSYLYGESFYSENGSKVFFGKPQYDDTIDVKYDVEMTHISIKASLQAPILQQYNYLSFYHEEQLRATRNSTPETFGYQRPVLDKSEEIYTSTVSTPLGALVHDSPSLQKMIDIERTRKIANMLVLSGETQTCKVGLGRVVVVSYPGEPGVSTSAGEFVVTHVVHTVDVQGGYRNKFSGVRAALGYIPLAAVPMPIAAAQRATVLSNADPQGKGRIKVQLQFHKYNNKETNWIKVLSPDAGSSKVSPKDRGYIFVPEVGDEVMIQFEGNDPARPYCTGSLFPETAARGGKENNHLKSIKTRSGHTIEFNDSDNAETIRIRDINANEILYDTRSKTITVSTLEQINLVSKTIRIDASEDFIVSVGRDMQQSVGNNFTHATSGESRISVGKSSVTNVENDYEVTANRNIEIESAKNTTLIVGDKLRQDVESNIDITSVGGKTNISSKGKIEVKSNDKVHIK